uniref:Secreted protein n=1 Tax=Steinernema glaseri TaxID=37863 RepID=A0A1I7YFV3_9BILA
MTRLSLEDATSGNQRNSSGRNPTFMKGLCVVVSLFAFVAAQQIALQNDTPIARRRNVLRCTRQSGLHSQHRAVGSRRLASPSPSCPPYPLSLLFLISNKLSWFISVNQRNSSSRNATFMKGPCVVVSLFAFVAAQQQPYDGTRVTYSSAYPDEYYYEGTAISTQL